MQVLNSKMPFGLWHTWQNMFLHICYCMMTRFDIFGNCLLAWCSFQYYCCLTVLQCHVPIMNNMPYYTMLVWHVEESRHTQVRCTSPRSLNPVLQSCTTPYQCDMWSIADASWSDAILLLGNQTQWYRALLHHVSLTCTRVEVYQGQMYTPCKLNPVLESCTILCQFDMWKNADVHRSDVTPHNPCYSKLMLEGPSTPCWFDMWKDTDIPRSDVHPNTNWTQCFYRALLHHVSLTCGSVQVYPGHMYTPY